MNPVIRISDLVVTMTKDVIGKEQIPFARDKANEMFALDYRNRECKNVFVALPLPCMTSPKISSSNSESLSHK